MVQDFSSQFNSFYPYARVLLLIIKHPVYKIVTVHSNLGKHKHFSTFKNNYAKKADYIKSGNLLITQLIFDMQRARTYAQSLYLLKKYLLQSESETNCLDYTINCRIEQFFYFITLRTNNCGLLVLSFTLLVSTFDCI